MQAGELAVVGSVAPLCLGVKKFLDSRLAVHAANTASEIARGSCGQGKNLTGIHPKAMMLCRVGGFLPPNRNSRKDSAQAG